MLGWSILVWGLVAAVVAPLSTALVGWIWRRGDASVVANEALLTWVLTPQGMAWLLVAGSLALVGVVLQYAGFFEVITADIEGRTASPVELGLRLPGRLLPVLRLCLGVTGAALVLALPLVAGLYGVREALLGARDINYYLYERPSEWWYAVAAAVAWLAAWGGAVAYLLGRSLLAVPAYLDGHRPLVAALRTAWRQTREEGGRIVRILLGAVLAWLAARFLVDVAVVAGSSSVIGWTASASSSVRPVVVATGASALLALAVDAAVAFLGVAFVSTVLTNLYCEDTGLHTSLPAGAGGRTLPERARRWAETWLRPRRLLPLAVAVVLSSAIAGAVLLGRVPEGRDVAVTAHRAGPPPSPENTLAALERSVAAGAGWAEVDVQLSGDGVPVVVHDADLMRMAGDPRRVAATGFDVLREVVQRPDDGTPAAERRVASLAEFLERSRGRIGLNIELKYYGRDDRLAEEVVRAVREAGMEEDVMVMSLDLGGVRQVRRMAPEIETGYAAAVAVGDLAALPVDFLAVSRSRVTGRLLRAARRRDVDVHVWTVNRLSAMAEVMQEGVDGVITDRPALAVRVRDEIAEMSAVSRLLLRFGELIIDEEDRSVADAAGTGSARGGESP